MTAVHLVRHGQPIMSEGPRSEWPLDPAGFDGIDHLAESEVLPGAARWFTSAERKAVETAARLGRPEASIVDDFREQERPNDLVKTLPSLVKRAMHYPDVAVQPGWETSNSTTRRVVAALESLDPLDEALVLVGHGFARTLLTANLTESEPVLIAWRSMLLPDHCSLMDGVVESAWSQWTSLS